ncbi:MAG: diaminopimelate decarboxylase [Candidatus Thorarchaeota archaeon]
MDYKDWLKRKDLKYQNGVLHIADVNTLDLAKRFGTPVYIVNERLIRERYRTLKQILNSEYHNNQIHYAVKANTNLSVLKILLSEGASFDCSSTGEIYSCLKAGAKADQIIYTGNMFTNEDFKFAVENEVLINLDSIGQIKRLAKVYDDLGKEKSIISFRINPEFGAGHHTHTITAGKEIKFGILDHQVIEAYSKAKEFGFEKFGTHIHIGSGIINASDYEKGINKYLDVIVNLADTLDITFEFLDFGGGLGIPYRPEEDPLDLTLYRDVVVKRFKETITNMGIREPEFKIEPGRYLSAEASIILTQINTMKDNGFKLFAGVDAGFNTLIRPTLYGSYHHIISCNIKNKEQSHIYDIAGPICESGDILGKEREMLELKEGEILAILDTGAYGHVMSSQYNSRPRPAEILIWDGKPFKIREEEHFDDLLKLQNIPEHLK